MRVAFDVDDTLWKIRRQKTPKGQRYDQVPDYDMIAVLRWFYENGDQVYVWSAGGMDYAQQIVNKLGLDDMVTVVPKRGWPTEGGGGSDMKIAPDMDIVFDDEVVTLGKVNVQVKRDKENFGPKE